MGPTGDLHAVEAVDRRPDNVKRWQDAQRTYPQASFTFDSGWFYGALRDADNIMRATDLGLLLDRLKARETYGPDAPV